ncbi:MAG: UDP-3-O-acyl-N-acetylglucosamine deacetylase [Parcubacteria group bacterium]|nr:UDP-3-O-acyl-N-acetylglucosamine deacetylase [Parcubacteria group bacterium]
MTFQKTILQPVEVRGINQYTQEMISIGFHPLEENKGVIFLVNGKKIPVNLDSAKLLKTAIFLFKEDVGVGMIEHFLPPIYALGIDNLLVKINFEKEPFALPTFENSSAEIFNALKSVGTIEQSVEKKYLTVDKPYFFKHRDQQKKDSILITPDKDFIINYRVSFPHKAVGEQIFSFEVTEHNFCSDIMEARSPAFLDRATKYTDQVNEKYNLLIGDKENPNYLNESRYSGQEFVRHKILDFLGTLALFGKQFKKIRFNINMSGHEFDLSALKQMKEKNYFK